MRTDLFFKIGGTLFGIAVLAIGIIHIVTGNFPVGLLPVPAGLPGRTFFAYADGVVMIVAGLLIISQKFAKTGAMLAAALFLILLLFVHLPLLFLKIHDGGEWTATFEVIFFLAGAMLILGIFYRDENTAAGEKRSAVLLPIGRYLMAAGFFVFGMLHYNYEAYIETLLLSWMPFKTFWCWLVMVAFFAAFVSFTVNKLVALSSLLISAMFGIWVLTLHGPLVATHMHVEPQWTSFFVAFATCGIGMLVYSSVNQPLKNWGIVGALAAK
jgi:hypothetical protein